MACYSSLCISNAILNRSPLPNFRLLSFYPLTIVHWSSKLRLSRGAEIPTRSGLPAIALSPLTATLMDLRASVANKRLTAWLSPLDATLTKNRGGVVHPLGRFDARMLEISDVATFRRLDVPPVPLRPNAFGATIRKGTRFLHHPGKQLRSPWCLRVRERTSGTVHRRSRSKTPTRSGSQVVPGSFVLMHRAF